MTTVQYLQAALGNALQRRLEAGGGAAAREFSLAITAIEDAQMRFTRGLAIEQGIFEPADLEA